MIEASELFKEAARFHKAGVFGSAESLYCRLLAHDEDSWLLHFCLGSLYAEANAPGRAITFLRRSLALNPDNYEACANLAAAYRKIGRKDKSFELNKRSLEIKPDNPMTLSNISGLFINAGDPEKAIYWADKALAFNPQMPEAANHRAMALLEMGRYEQGFAEYDARLRLPKFHRRPFTCPMWEGQPVKRLAIHGEQGLGDEIMFLTCLNQLKDRAQEIAIEVSPRLVPLMQSSFPGFQVYGKHEDLPFEPDAYIAMGSLPRLCWPVKPNAYLKPSAFFLKTGLRIGLSWFGGTMHTHQELRNTVIEDWKTLLDFDADYISLQYGPAGEEAANLGIPHDAEAIQDLNRLAMMVKSCDLVITVCNTTVHMAGALGVPCIVLVPEAPAWRYGLKGERMVWYDSPLMVRQKAGEPWASVIQRAKAKCADLGIVSRAEQAVA